MGSPAARSWLIFGTAAVAAGLATAAFASVLLFPAYASIRMPADDIGRALASFLAAAASVWAAYRASGRPRLGWILMALSAGAWNAGEAIWSNNQLRLGTAVAFPSRADVGFVASIPFAFAAVVAFWQPGIGPQSRWRVLLDGLIVFSSLTFTAWAVGLKAVWVDMADGEPLLRNLVEAATPLGDLAVGTVLILGIRRATHSQQVRMLLLLGGIACYTLAGTAFSYLAANGLVTGRGTVLDTGWVAGYLLVALAAILPSRQVRAAERSPYDLWQIALPWIAVVAAGISVSVIAVTGRQLDLVLTALVGVGAGLLVVSVVLAQRDSFVALAASRQSQTALAEVIARAPSGVAKIGADMRVIDANPRFTSLMQVGGSQVGRPIRSYFHGAEASRFIAALLGLEDPSEAVEGDIEVRPADGSTKWVHWSAAGVEGSDGRIQYYVAMFDDTTARHDHEIAAAASLEVLERLNRLKTEFLQSVSHEFKTALLGIQGFSEFMRDADELDVNDARAYAADIYRDAERLDRMVTEMLALDQVESSRAAVRMDSVDVEAVIRQETDSARRELEVHGCHLELIVEAGLPAVAGDAAKLSEVVRTLLLNAVNRSPEGGTIEIRAWAVASGIEVSVSDEGVGTRPEFDSRLFGQDDLYANSPIRKVVATGLGLGIARRVVEMHGGRMWVAGDGCEFHFSLPVPGRSREARAAP